MGTSSELFLRVEKFKYAMNPNENDYLPWSDSQFCVDPYSPQKRRIMSMLADAIGTTPLSRPDAEARGCAHRGITRWRQVKLLTASFIAYGSLAFSAAPGPGLKTTESVDPIQTDVNVSGPFLQKQATDPHDGRAIDRCGEPEIAQDSVHPDTLVINCMSQGGLGMNYQSPAPEPFVTWSYKDPTKTVPWTQPCHVFISHDGGRTWMEILPSPIESQLVTNCEDPLAASGPQGQLYVGGDAVHFPADGKFSPVLPDPPSLKEAVPQQLHGIAFTRSLDGGRTWSHPIVIPTAGDRPFWTVDQSTGVIFDLSSCSSYDPATKLGAFGCTPKTSNLAVSTDGGQTWNPSVDPFNKLPPSTTLTPGRLHNIGASFSCCGGPYITAAYGIFATATSKDGGEEEESSSSVSSGPLYFKYSTDQGRNFLRRPIALSRATCESPGLKGVAANPARRGTFAVLLACGDPPKALRVYLTEDLGTTWSEVAPLAVVPPPDYRGRASNFDVNRTWIAYGPTGALGVLWRQAYGTPPIAAGPTVHYGPQDVFLALARDGRAFDAPIRLNTAASPPADPRIYFGDDESGLIIDRHYAYAVWGDWRSGELQTWFRKVPLPN